MLFKVLQALEAALKWGKTPCQTASPGKPSGTSGAHQVQPIVVGVGQAAGLRRLQCMLPQRQVGVTVGLHDYLAGRGVRVKPRTMDSGRGS